jgi:hypothetical protein
MSEPRATMIMLENCPSPVAAEQKFKISLKNPITGMLLQGDCEYNSLMEAHRAAENWKAAQYLTHWYVVIKDLNGIKVADDSLGKPDCFPPHYLLRRRPLTKFGTTPSASERSSENRSMPSSCRSLSRTTHEA